MGLTYDALDRMVEQNRSGAYTQFMYSPTGFKMQILNGQTVTKNFVQLPGGATAVWTGPTLTAVRHPDWLGSSRFASTPSRTMYSDTAYAPFGEPYAQAGTADTSFTGQNQDTVSGDYDFLYRPYSIQGRWPTPDPAGLASVHLSDPQTLNRYAYVRNNPLSNVDPLGLCGDDGVWDCQMDQDPPGGGGGGDPTSGGDPHNSGSDLPLNTELISPDGSPYFLTDSSDYTAEVSASLSDGTQPVIETEGAPIGTTLQQDCGGCLLAQMQNSPESMAIFNGASDLVTYGALWDVAGVGAAFGAGAVASLEWVDVAVGYGETAQGSPLFHVAVGSDGQWVSAFGQFGNMTMEDSAVWAENYKWFQVPVPVLNTGAVMATTGTFSTCVSGVCQAIANGWTH